MKFPVNFPVSREFAGGDRFECDCVRHHALSQVWRFSEGVRGAPIWRGLGVFFQNAITSVLATLTELGTIGILAIVACLALYLLFKWWRRMLFIRQLRMDRITVPELRELIDAGQELVILDVRPRQVRVQDGIIPGAIFAHPEDIDPIVKSYAPGTEIIVYCACPNEESAATAAKHLKQAGFKKIRPLLGGMEAWVKAGHPIEPAEPDKKAA